MKKQLKKFPNYYITDNGVIYDENNEVVNTFKNPIGYVSAVLNDRIVTVAYLVANTFISNDDKCILVGYKDHDFNNLNADNLYWYYQGEYEDKTQETEANREKRKEKEIGDGYFKIDRDNNILDTYTGIIDIKKKTGKWVNVHIYNKSFVTDLNCYFVSQNDYYESDNIAAELNELNEKVKSRKAILKLDYKGNILSEFNSTTEVARENKMALKTLSRILDGEARQRKDYYLIPKKDYSINTIQFRLDNELKRIENEKIKREQKKEEKRIEKEKENRINERLMNRLKKQQEKERQKEEKRIEQEQREAERRIRQEQKEAERQIQKERRDADKQRGKEATRIEKENRIKERLANKLKKQREAENIREQREADKQRRKEQREEERRIRQEQKKATRKKGRPIQQYTLDNVLVKTYNSIREIEEETGFKRTNIYNNLCGDSQMAFNYKWCYLGETSRKNKVKKCILQYDLEGNLIKEYETINEAVEETGIKYMTIYTNLQGRTKQVFGKYIFKYK